MISKLKVIIPIVVHYTTFITRRPTSQCTISFNDSSSSAKLSTMQNKNYVMKDEVYQTRIIRSQFAVVSQD